MAKQLTKAKSTSMDFIKKSDGLEDFTTEDFQTPFLRIIQSNSPEIKQGSDGYIKNAREGDLVLRPDGVLYKTAFVIPIKYQKIYLEWPTSIQDKMLIANHGDKLPPDAIADENPGTWKSSSGNIIQSTSQYFAMIFDDDKLSSYSLAAIPMTGASQKKSRMWNTMMRNLHLKQKHNYPMFVNVYELSTTTEQNSKGVWMNWVINFHKCLIKSNKPINNEASTLMEEASKIRSELTQKIQQSAEMI